MHINKKMVAREWLVFISLLVFGFLFMPQFSNVSYSVFFEGLFDDYYGEWFITWLKLLTPYIVLQTIRSLIWAAKVTFSKQGTTN